METSRDFTDIGKMEGSSLVLERTRIVVPQLCARALDQVGPLAADKNLSLVSLVEDHLPPLYGDQEKLQRTLTNLLGNAIKFTPPEGTIALSAAFAARPGRTDSFVLSVSDTGEGIPEDAFGSIFEFGQVAARQSGRSTSTVLGLTFCKMVVEAHRGRIWVESKIGQGSNFIFALPARA